MNMKTPEIIPASYPETLSEVGFGVTCYIEDRQGAWMCVDLPRVMPNTAGLVHLGSGQVHVMRNDKRARIIELIADVADGDTGW